MPRVTSAPYLRPLPAPEGEPEGGRTQTLVVRALAGDEAAWARLYQESFDDVFRHVRYLTGDPGVAEELAQESFAQAMASGARYDRARPFGAWLHGIALNVVRKHWRSQHSRERAHARLRAQGARREGGDDPGDAHQRKQRSQRLYAVLDDLPERLREAFILREIQGLSAAETGELLGIRPGNVAVRVTRARARIREALVARGWVEPEGAAP